MLKHFYSYFESGLKEDIIKFKNPAWNHGSRATSEQAHMDQLLRNTLAWSADGATNDQNPTAASGVAASNDNPSGLNGTALQAPLLQEFNSFD